MKADRRFVLPISPALLHRMRNAAARVAEREREFVVFAGTARRPWGKYLATETEAEHAVKQRPPRELRDLTADELAELLIDIQDEDAITVALRYHVSHSTLNHIVYAAQHGFLVRSSASSAGRR